MSLPLSLVPQTVKRLPAMQEIQVQPLGPYLENFMEWGVLWLHGVPQSMGSESQTRLSNFTFTFPQSQYLLTYWIELLPLYTLHMVYCLLLFKIFYFWLRFVAARGLSLAAASKGYSLVAVHGLLIVVASPAAERTVLEHVGCRSCGPWV